MRHLLLITLCLATLSACSCRQKPEQVAQAFLESFFASDYQQARVYATAQIADILDKTQSILDSLSQEEHQEVKSYLSAIRVTVQAPEKIRGDTVRLAYKVDFSRLPGPGESFITLRREGRKWKVYALE
ncbi:MAG: hypothetical protein PHC79_02380 [Bacteroidales bacterium]|nr:hypothetical protein [Bacteroidales bacterium]